MATNSRPNRSTILKANQNLTDFLGLHNLEEFGAWIIGASSLTADNQNRSGIRCGFEHGWIITEVEQVGNQ